MKPTKKVNDTAYKPRNPEAYEKFCLALAHHREDGKFTPKERVEHCRRKTIEGLVIWAGILQGDDLARLQATIAHLSGALPVVPLSLRLPNASRSTH